MSSNKIRKKVSNAEKILIRKYEETKAVADVMNSGKNKNQTSEEDLQKMRRKLEKMKML